MSEEHEPSYFAEQGFDLEQQDFEDFLGNVDFDPDMPDMPFDEDYDFGNEQGLGNVESTEFKTPDAEGRDLEKIGDFGNIKDGERSHPVLNTSPHLPQPELNSQHGSENNTPEIGGPDGGNMLPRETNLSTMPSASELYSSQDPRIVSLYDETFSRSQPGNSLSRLESQPQHDENQSWNDQQESSNSPNDAGNSGQQKSPFDFDNEDWKNHANEMTSGDPSQTSNTGVQEHQGTFNDLQNEDNASFLYQSPYSNLSKPLQPLTNTQQESAVHTPAIDSRYRPVAIPGETAHDLVPTTHCQLDNTVGLAGRQGLPIAVNPAVNALRSDHHAAADEAKSDNSDGEQEQNDVPNQAAFETFEENDPLILPDEPVQKGWGRIGQRNGTEVWFNPDTSKWRELQL